MIDTPVSPTTEIRNWSEQKARLKAKYTILTDSYLHYENDNREEILKKIQFKLGKTKEELDAIILAL